MSDCKMAAMQRYVDLPENVNALTGNILDSLYHVHRELGPGYPEKIYEDACVVEFRRRSLSFERQKTYRLFYKGEELPTSFQLDLVVEGQVVLELKAVEKIHPAHQSQIYSYLKATNLPVGFLVNFNVSLIKEGIGRYVNKNSVSPGLRVKEQEKENV